MKHNARPINRWLPQVSHLPWFRSVASATFRSSVLLRGLVVLLFIILSACSQPIGSSSTQAQPSPQSDAPVRGERLPGRLLFVRNGTVWLWQGDAGRPLFGIGNAYQPAFSPDGSQIAYVERGNSYSDLLLADENGQLIQRLTSHEPEEPPNSFARAYASRWAWYPAWDPASESLSFAGQAGPPFGDPAIEYNLGLYRYVFAETAYEPLVIDDALQVTRSAYNPSDSLLVVFAAAMGNSGGQQLYRLLLTDDSVQQLANLPQPSYDPAWSADGAWLAFAATTNSRTDIYAVAAPLSGQPVRLTALGNARAPAFSPDGKQIAFLALDAGGGFDLWVADLAFDAQGNLQTTNPRQVTRGLGLDGDSGISWGK
jgi:TolB protein